MLPAANPGHTGTLQNVPFFVYNPRPGRISYNFLLQIISPENK
jgi:hypothetical protein